MALAPKRPARSCAPQITLSRRVVRRHLTWSRNATYPLGAQPVYRGQNCGRFAVPRAISAHPCAGIRP